MCNMIAFWGAVIFVVAVLALTAGGNLLEWKKARFHIPAFLHVWALLLLGGFAFYSWPIGFLAAFAVYALYGILGNHLARRMMLCEQRAERHTENDEARIALSRELCRFKSMSRADLVAMLWKNLEKEIQTPDSSWHKLRIEVVPADYRWEGGNVERFSTLTQSVKAGGNIKVIGMLTPLKRGVWRSAAEVCLSFQMDGDGGIHADTSDPANRAAA